MPAVATGMLPRGQCDPQTWTWEGSSLAASIATVQRTAGDGQTSRPARGSRGSRRLTGTPGWVEMWTFNPAVNCVWLKPTPLTCGVALGELRTTLGLCCEAVRRGRPQYRPHSKGEWWRYSVHNELGLEMM